MYYQGQLTARVNQCRAARYRAIASPIPDAAPVTTATRSFVPIVPALLIYFATRLWTKPGIVCNSLLRR